jgi:hypothetical protein
MVRMILMSMLVTLIFSGCSTKEFNDGVSDVSDGLTRVIRGTNN